MRAQFEGQAAEAMAAARARQAEKVAAAGGIEEYRRQAAEHQLVAAAWRRAEQAQAAAEVARKRARTAERAAEVAVLVAEGMWVAAGDNGFSGHKDPAAAKAAAERSRAAGYGASISRPYCGHWWDDRLTAADSPCRGCGKAAR